MSPTTKRVVITDRCDQDCVFCSGASGAPKGKGVFNRQRILQYIRQRKGAVRLNISGGEPTLSPHLAEYIRSARGAGYQTIALLTNGARFSDKTFAAEMKRSGLTETIVSIQHLSPAVNRRITGPGTLFSKKMAGFRNLREIGMKTTANIVIFSYNSSALLGLVKRLAAEMGVRHFVFSFLETNCDRVKNDPCLIPALRPSLSMLKKTVEYCKKESLSYCIPYDGALPPCVFKKYKIRTNRPETVDGSNFDASKFHVFCCLACPERPFCRGFLKDYFAESQEILFGER